MIEQFNYAITGLGWAEMTLMSNTGEKSAITISYCNEPLPELLDALCRLLNKGSRFELIEMTGDNYNFALILSEIIPGLTRIEVLEDAYFEVLDTLKERVPVATYTAYDETYRLCYEVLCGQERLVKNMGPEQYKKQWRSDFPIEKLAELKEALRQFNIRE